MNKKQIFSNFKSSLEKKFLEIAYRLAWRKRKYLNKWGYLPKSDKNNFKWEECSATVTFSQNYSVMKNLESRKWKNNNRKYWK